MKHISRWFTLLEILLVLVIIGILLTVTLKFWGNRMQELDVLTLKQQTFDAMESLYRPRLTSNYYQGTTYDQLVLTFTSWTTLSSEYLLHDTVLWTDTVVFPSWVSVDTLSLWGKEEETVRVSFVPYTIDCTANDTVWSDFHFRLQVKNITHCYTFSSACSLVEEKCE